MPIFLVEDQWAKMTKINPKSYSGEEIKEGQLKQLLQDSFQFVDPDVMIIDTEFNGWEGTNRRVDLLGLDRQGNLVIIELKRTDDGGHMELQSLRYAAMISDFDLKTVIQIYTEFLERSDLDSSSANHTILNFLELEIGKIPVISDQPRIILISPGISQEIARTVIWLNSMGLNIRYVECKLYILDNKEYLDIEQVIPLPSAQEYTYKLNLKAADTRKTTEITRGERHLKRLIVAQILVPERRIHLIKPPRPNLLIPDETMKFATYIGKEKFKWDYDDVLYSLSKLTEEVCLASGGYQGSGSFQGTLYWAFVGESTSLRDRSIDPIIINGESANEEIDE